MLSLSLSAQKLDYRATLNVQSSAQSFSLAPDGRLWMATRIGELFYADSIGGLWHEVKLHGKSSLTERYLIDHVFTPDSHTVVLAGYIRTPNDRNCTGNYIISSDNGHTWDFRSLDTCSEWIDASWRKSDGRIWIGGLSGRLLYSDDLGQTFRVIHRTDTAGDRISAIWLDESGQQGILAILGNKLQITDDGFKSVRRIETPKTQGALVLEQQRWYGRISEAFQWQQWLMVNQEGHWFYAHRDTLEWHPLPLFFSSWALSPDGTMLIAMSTEGLVSMLSPTEWHKISDAYGRIIATDGNRIILTKGGIIISVTQDGNMAKYPQLTTDYDIEEPYHKVHYDGSLWGFYNHDIYIKKGHRWGRVVHTDFAVTNLRPADTCLLVESTSDIYSITRKRTTPLPMRYINPLDNFLKSKPVEVSIVSSSRSCYNNYSDTVCYRRMSAPSHALTRYGDHFRLTSLSLSDTVLPLPVRFFEAEELEALLADFNNEPNPEIHRKDLNITNEDLKTLLADTALYKEYRGSTPHVLKMVAEGFDTISDTTVSTALTAPEGGWSTLSKYIQIIIVNAADDTMTISRQFFFNPPYLLPYHVSLPGRSLYATNMPLISFLGAQMPKEMLFSNIFTPLSALRRIAEYLDINR